MIEATEEALKSSLQNILSYAFIGIQALWTALSTPENIPVFVGSLIKFSLGPTLAFLLSQWSFRREEGRKKHIEEKDRSERKKSIRLVICLEITHNIKTLEAVKKSFEDEIKQMEIADVDSGIGIASFFRALDSFFIFRDRFLFMDSLVISESFSIEEISSLNDLYSNLEGIKTGLLEIRRLDLEIREEVGMEFSGVDHLRTVSLILQRGIDKGRSVITVLSADET